MIAVVFSKIDSELSAVLKQLIIMLKSQPI